MSEVGEIRRVDEVTKQTVCKHLMQFGKYAHTYVYTGYHPYLKDRHRLTVKSTTGTLDSHTCIYM